MKQILFTPLNIKFNKDETKTSITDLAGTVVYNKRSLPDVFAKDDEDSEDINLISKIKGRDKNKKYEKTVYGNKSVAVAVPNVAIPPQPAPAPGTSSPSPGTGAPSPGTGAPSPGTSSPLKPMEEVVYSDYAFEIPQHRYRGYVPPNGAAVGSKNNFWFDFASIYNFYIQPYENVTTRFEEIEGISTVPEHLLPNLYVFLSELDQAQLDPASIANGSPFFKHITLNGNIQNVLKDIYLSTTNGSIAGAFPKSKKRNIAIAEPGSPSTPQTKFFGSEKDNASYYEEWSRAIKEVRKQTFNYTINPASTATRIEAQNYAFKEELNLWFPNLTVFKNIIVPTIGLPLLNDLSERRRMFPMWVNVEFNTDFEISSKTSVNNVLGRKFRELGLTAFLMKEIVEDTEIRIIGGSKGKSSKQFATPWHKWMQLDRASNAAILNEDLPDNPNLSHGNYYRTWDMGQFLMSSGIGEEIVNKELISNKWVLLNDYTSRQELEAKLCGVSGGPLCTEQQKRDALKQAQNELARIMLTPDSPFWRTHKQILAGKKAYSETIFYKVEKRLLANSDDLEGTVIQNIYLPNAQKTLKYIDTQVNYGVKYKYRIYAYQLVCGNKYRYKVDQMPRDPTVGRYSIFFENNQTLIGSEGSIDAHTGEVVTKPQEGFYMKDWVTFINRIFTDNSFTAGAYNRPIEEQVAPATAPVGKASPFDMAQVCALSELSMILVEVPQFEFDTIVVDQPPISPEVDLIPYRAISNKMLINLNGAVGDYVRAFKIMKESDQKYLDSYKLNQKTEIQGRINVFQQGTGYQRPDKPLTETQFAQHSAPITFRSDDPSTRFEIWRTDSKPEKWTDFKLVETVDSDKFFDKPNQKAASASFVDDIKPNKKYWYTFRAIDIHGNVSNPTTVYEIMMHDDKGTVWLDISLFPDTGLHVGELGPADLSTPFKTGQRFIQIKPSAMQTVINERESDFIDQATGNRVPSLRPFNLTGDPAVLGSSQNKDSLWSGESAPEKFKIRLTSKKSGRKMDLNFYATVKHIKNPQVKLKK